MASVSFRQAHTHSHTHKHTHTHTDMYTSDFYRYSDNSREERPLYLFDKHFTKNSPALADDYQVPVYFQQDLFSLLGEANRPDWRWLIIGPVCGFEDMHVCQVMSCVHAHVHVCVHVYFELDLFSVLGKANRPDWRWLIVGPVCGFVWMSTFLCL